MYSILVQYKVVSKHVLPWREKWFRHTVGVRVEVLEGEIESKKETMASLQDNLKAQL